MKKQSRSDVGIAIEWHASSTDGCVGKDTGAPSTLDLRALAAALGRMAAKRDLARTKAKPADLDMIPAGMMGKVKAPA